LRVEGSGCWAWGLEFGVLGLGFRVEDLLGLQLARVHAEFVLELLRRPARHSGSTLQGLRTTSSQKHVAALRRARV